MASTAIHLEPQTAPVGRRDLILAGALALLSGVILLDSWRDILRLGLANEELSYVLLAPVMIVWVAWSRRHTLSNCRLRGGWLGLMILLFGWFTYWFGFHVDPVLWRAGAVVVAVGAVVSVLGRDVFWKFAP